MCARPDRSTYTRWVALLLLLLACASVAGCLGPGLEPPDGDNASSGEDRGEGGDAGGVGSPVNPPAGASGSGGRAGASGAGGASPGAGGNGGGQPSAQDAGQMTGDAGIDDEDGGATR
jgi:hypothetical protein